MKNNRHTASAQDILLEDFVAELTRAAYAVALRHGRRHLWLDLELDLWCVLTDTVQKCSNSRRNEIMRWASIRH